MSLSADFESHNFLDHVMNNSARLEALIHDNITITLADSTTAFNFLGASVKDENNVLIFINNVFQEADVAYTIAGTTVTFTSAPPNTHKIVALRGFDTV